MTIVPVIENFIQNYHWLIPPVFSMVISIVLVPFIIKLNKWLNCFDEPDERKIHQHKTATLGGLGMFLSIVVTYFVLYQFKMPLYFWISIMLLVITGLVDDVWGLTWIQKLNLQTIASTIFVSSGFNYSQIFYQLGLDFVPSFLQALIIGVLIVLYINAFNLIDGMDGLAGGIALINFTTFAFLNYYFGNYALAWFCLIIIGSIIGFLIFNIHPAKIFMGDTGSLMLGFLLIVVAFTTFQYHYHIDSISTYEKKMFFWVVFFILLLPFADAIRVAILRILKGKAPYKPAKDHIHHILLKSGLGQTQAIMILYAINVMLVLTGIIVYLNKSISIIISVLLLKM